VSVLVPPGQSPATYEPLPRQIADLAAARVYFRIGVPFEKQVVAKVASTLKDLNIVDIRAGIELRDMEGKEEHEPAGQEREHGHGHDEEADHHHQPGEQDPHVWMNPRLVKIQARTICTELSRLDPAHQADYAANLATFEAALDDVDREIAVTLAPLKGREFFVFHPAYGYFADAYGLKQTAIEAGGRQPTAKQLAALIQRAKDAHVRLIFVQPQFNRSNAETIAREIGGAVVPLDPLAEDYIENLRHMTQMIRQALSAPGEEEPGTP
jgi:zinc transport system substrate-binding protein